jgi:hypothetical protein
VQVNASTTTAAGEQDISVKRVIEAQRRLSASKSAFDRVVGTLGLAGLLKQRFTALPDEVLGQLMFD